MSLLLNITIADEFYCAVPKATSHSQAGFPEIASVMGIGCPHIPVLLCGLGPPAGFVLHCAKGCGVVVQPENTTGTGLPARRGAVPKGEQGHEGSAPGLINEQWPLHVDAVQSRMELRINTSVRLDKLNNINFNHAENKIFCFIFSTGK